MTDTETLARKIADDPSIIGGILFNRTEKGLRTAFRIAACDANDFRISFNFDRAYINIGGTWRPLDLEKHGFLWMPFMAGGIEEAGDGSYALKGMFHDGITIHPTTNLPSEADTLPSEMLAPTPL